MAVLIKECVYPDPKALLAAAESALREEFSKDLPHPHAVLLSGGSTPLPVYAAIAAEPSPISSTLHVSYTDDRHVPFDSEDSNHGHARPMLEALGVPEDQQLTIEPDGSLDDAGAAFEQTLDGFLGGGGKISFALLGMGGDTHTCSLFGDEDLAAAGGHRAIAVRRPEPPHRVSVTPALLEQVERIVFLVSGASKQEVIQQLLNAPETTIAGRAVANCSRVELWHD